ncbi:hypothetical protein RF11_11077 [Thelohanellus kitauei]|uniref:Uncharacterized protein n=1 Tax=Thelohanellus kitauei TaxID=669202 RepID=A0A0C2JJ66_THEKT|nr:hypothetical protein RF11_11077 [Thelohanellus kitauei]
MVDYRLRLDCKEEDLGICLVSNPDYFEHFILTKCDLTDQHFIENPLDESRYLILNEAKNILNEFLKVHANYGYEIQLINSCDLDPVSRLPLIDVQVAAHVSGIAYLYKETSKNYTCPIPACENTRYVAYISFDMYYLILNSIIPNLFKLRLIGITVNFSF